MTTLEIILAVSGVGAVLFFLIWAFVRGGNGKTEAHRAPVVKNPPLPPPLPTPKPAPELSCFARGLIKSFEVEPEKWKTSFVHHTEDDTVYSAKHSDTRIFMFYAAHDIQWISTEENLTSEEKSAVAKALHFHVIERQTRLNREREHSEGAKHRKYFEQLGCPPKNAEETS